MSDFHVQGQHLIEQPDFLIVPILHVIVRQFQVEAPKHLGHDQVHFSPRQPVRETSAPRSREKACGIVCLRLAQAVARTHHEWLIHVFPVGFEPGIRFLEPPFWVEIQRVDEVEWRQVSCLPSDTHASLRRMVSKLGSCYA